MIISSSVNIFRWTSSVNLVATGEVYFLFEEICNEIDSTVPGFGIGHCCIGMY